MPVSVLLTYASTRGSTEEVAEVILKVLNDAGMACEMRAMGDVRSLASYDAVVMGAPLYMFRWHKDAKRFLKKQRDALQQRPVAVFALGPVHDPHDEEEWQNSWSQLRNELAKFPWFEPMAIEMFGGRYDPEQLGFPLKIFAGSEPASDIRDWDAIRAWAGEISDELRATSN